MLVGLFLELVHDKIVLWCALGACQHRILVFYVEKILCSHDCLESVSNHYNGDLL